MLRNTGESQYIKLSEKTVAFVKMVLLKMQKALFPFKSRKLDP